MTTPTRKPLSAPLTTFLLVSVFAIGGAVAATFTKDHAAEDKPAEPTAALTTGGASPATAPAYSVFVDEETRFAFIKLASGEWTFVRQLDQDQMSRLHPTTLVAKRQASVETVAAAEAGDVRVR